ncbi:DUF4253 domain-containing protein [Sphingomonas sp. NPDC019816]|uniref:DUF4253 domain-containing protein n=1 Tax=Sphingomonas sp. NPDC019816 TaxID=3390679 RepID=UPI003CFC6E68
MEPTRRLLIGGLATVGLSGMAGREAMSRSVPAPPAPDPNAVALRYDKITVPGAQALAEWEKCRAAKRGWPVVVGGDADLERIAEQFSLNNPVVSGAAAERIAPRSTEQILAASAKVEFPADLYKAAGISPPQDDDVLPKTWPAPSAEAPPGLTVAQDLQTGRPLEKAHILILPTERSWEAPAYLRWGGWNACPPPELHVAALRSWHARFGAELAGLNGDTMNVRIRNRPKDRQQAWQLAHELHAYCPDIVDQGIGSMAAFASELIRADWWFFWWD